VSAITLGAIALSAYSAELLPGVRAKSCGAWKSVFSAQFAAIQDAADSVNALDAKLTARGGFGDLQNDQDILDLATRFQTSTALARSVATDEFFDSPDSLLTWRVPVRKLVKPFSSESVIGILRPLTSDWTSVKAMRAQASFLFHDPISLGEIRSQDRFQARFDFGTATLSLAVSAFERCIVSNEIGGRLTPTGKALAPTPFFVRLAVTKKAEFENLNTGAATSRAFGDILFLRLGGKAQDL